jgi:pyruvate/2-oxoacid:ferredoxin oxidoreductase alpha subunit
MLDLTYAAFDLAFEYRNPVVVVADGYLGQMTGRVELPREAIQPGLPDWAVWGDREHRRNLLASIYLSENDLEDHNTRLNRKYERMWRNEQRADEVECEGADWIIVACNTPARMAKGAVHRLRAQGVRAGLLRPITLWPFPIDALAPHLASAKGIVMVEAGPGQLEDELRLAVSHAGLALPPIHPVRHFGGVLPQPDEIVEIQ